MKCKVMPKRLVIVATLIMLLITILISACIVINMYLSTFSCDKWELLPSMRYKMIDNLEKEYDLIGKTEQDVIALLGTSEDTWEYDISSGKYKLYHYSIGPSNSFDCTIYQITFCDGIVTGTSTYRT